MFSIMTSCIYFFIHSDFWTIIWLLNHLTYSPYFYFYSYSFHNYSTNWTSFGFYFHTFYLNLYQIWITCGEVCLTYVRAILLLLSRWVVETIYDRKEKGKKIEEKRRDEMNWIELNWNEMKWNEMKWNEMKWNEKSIIGKKV